MLPVPQAAGPDPRRWLMLGVALLSQITISVVMQGVPALAPLLQADMGLTRAEVGLFTSALQLGTLSALAFAGWAVDTLGERVVLTVGTAAVGLFGFGVAATAGFYAALAALVLVGVGAAVPTPAGSKTVMVWFPVHQRGTAMGVRQTGIPLGGALAAATLPPLALALGWRAAVAAGGLGCLVAAAVCWLAYRRPSGPASTDRGRSRSGGSQASIRPREVLLLGLVGAILPLGQFCLITYLAIYLRETQQTPLTVSAALLVGAQLAGAAGRVAWGAWSDRLFGGRRRPALILCVTVAALANLALGWLPLGVSPWLIWAVVLVFGFTAIAWHGNWIALTAELAGPERQGRTVGQVMTLCSLGIVVLPPLFGYFVDVMGSWSLAWSLVGLILMVGAALLLPVREGQRG